MRRRKSLIVSGEKSQVLGLLRCRCLIDETRLEQRQKSHPKLTRCRVTKIRCSRQKTDKHFICNGNWWRARQDSNPRPPGS